MSLRVVALVFGRSEWHFVSGNLQLVVALFWGFRLVVRGYLFAYSLSFSVRLLDLCLEAGR